MQPEINPMSECETELPDDALYRLKHIVGTGKDPQEQPIIPVARSTWFKWIKLGIAPKPIHLGPRAVAWRGRDLNTFRRGNYWLQR